jgi:hypothetical protein
VRADEAVASALGITSVPCFVVERAYGAAGAQPADVLAGLLERAWRERRPLSVVSHGDGCTDETHLVRGVLMSVSRSDSASVGSGYFEASLVHHRAWVFGQCWSYSASINGTLSLIF